MVPKLETTGAASISAIRLESATAASLFSAAAFLGISAEQLDERLLTEALTEPLAASGTVFLAELAIGGSSTGIAPRPRRSVSF